MFAILIMQPLSYLRILFRSTRALEYILFWLIILFLPTQLGKHFWPDFSYVSGIRADYLSPTIYTTDVLIVLLFFVFMISKFSIFNFQFSLKSKILNIKNSLQILNIKNSLQILNFKFQILFVTLLLIGIWFSKNPLAGLYGLLKLAEFSFFGWYVARHLNSAVLWQAIVWALSIGIISEALIAIAQFLNQSSIGGIFYFFGERTFTGQTPGIANASLAGELMLRPYGTFSHPNVLAGYLTIATAIVISNLKSQMSNVKIAIYCLTVVVGTIALILTMSRAAILLWICILLIYVVKRSLLMKAKLFIHNSLFLILILLLLIGALFLSPIRYRFEGINFSDESFALRNISTQTAIAMIQDNSILGVGINNYLSNVVVYQDNNRNILYLQPVHNIYLLVASQTGLIGFFFFILFILKAYKRIRNQESGIRKKNFIIHNSLFTIFSSVCFLGFFDHYFLTLQQGQLLFSLVFGLCWATNKK